MRNIISFETLPAIYKGSRPMRTSMSFLAGAGTVIVALAAGLGGGLVISNIVSPHQAPLSKVERQATADRQAQPSQPPQPQPSPVASNNAPSSYLAQVQPAANAPVTVTPAPSNAPQPQAEASAPAPEKSAANEAAAKPADIKPAEEAKPADAKPVQVVAPAPQPSPAQQASRDQSVSPDNAYAKARDADLKQLEAKKKAERADRRQQWATRRAQQRDPDMRDVERAVREDSDTREVIVRRENVDRDDDDRDDRSDFGRPRPFNFPRMLFGRD
jgi:hypothetical protein